MKTKPPWIDKADAALQRAARRAHEIAARTHTPVQVMRNGKIVKLMPGAGDPVLREEPPAGGTRQP